MIGAINPAAVIAAQLAGPQSPRPQMGPEQSFVWGRGGSRMTPEDIARERERAAAMMQTDYSPVASPWQGLARVAENVVGALRERRADKAATANADYSARIAQSLFNPGSSSGSGSPGADQSPAPGGNPAALMQIIADPYANDSVKALAQMQLVQQQKVAMKQLEWANREQPEIVQLAQIANDATRPQWERDAARDRVEVLNNPEIVVPIEGRGTFVGGRKDLRTVLGGGSVGGPNVGDVVDGHRFLGGNPKDKGSWQPVSAPDAAPTLAGAPQPPTIMQPWQYDGFVQSMGKEAADAFLARNGITVGGR